jgi:hypothetical protein
MANKKMTTCKDGFNMSVQSSKSHYCTPRENDCGYYSEVEVGFPSEKEDLLMPWCEDGTKPTATIYAFVPIEIIMAIVKKHGGLK